MTWRGLNRAGAIQKIETHFNFQRVSGTETFPTQKVKLLQARTLSSNERQTFQTDMTGFSPGGKSTQLFGTENIRRANCRRIGAVRIQCIEGGQNTWAAKLNPSLLVQCRVTESDCGYATE
jgi:hypothetical protein